MYSMLHVTLFRVQIAYNLCIKMGGGIRMFFFLFALAVCSIRFLKQMAWWQPRLCGALQAACEWTLRSLLRLCIPVLAEICKSQFGESYVT